MKRRPHARYFLEADIFVYSLAIVIVIVIVIIAAVRPFFSSASPIPF